MNFIVAGCRTIGAAWGRLRDRVLTKAPAPVAPAPEPLSLPWAPKVRVVPSQSLARALARLGFSMLGREAETGDAASNRVVSPLGLGYALGMLHTGASGKSAEEIGMVLGVSAEANAGLGQHFLALNELLSQTDPCVDFQIANRVWVSHTAASQLLPTFPETLERCYLAHCVPADMGDGAATARDINAWIDSATHGRIGALMDAEALLPQTRAIYANAVYFKGTWNQPFQSEDTGPAPFHLGNGQSVLVPTMNQTFVARASVPGSALLGVELPYGDGEFVLLLMMPRLPTQTIDVVLAESGEGALAQWRSALAYTPISLSVPKCRIALDDLNLKPVLQAAGLSSAFEDGRDFAAMLGDGAPAFRVNDLIQAAMFELDEQGSVASAVTVSYLVAASPDSEPAVHQAFRFDRPFFFALTHRNSGTPLFMGVVRDPSL